MYVDISAYESERTFALVSHKSLSCTLAPPYGERCPARTRHQPPLLHTPHCFPYSAVGNLNKKALTIILYVS